MLKNFFILLSSTLVLQTTIFAQITTNPYQAGLTFSPIRISLYAGIDNYFKLNSQLPAERWELKATNGTIEFSSFGDIVVRPEIAGRDTMYFYFIADNNQKKLVFMQVLSVNPLPPAKINLGKNNKISLAELKSLKTINISMPNMSYDFSYFIKECRVVTISTTGVKTEFVQTGNSINDEIQKHFKTLKKGDLVLIKEVKVLRSKNNVVEDADGIFLTIM